MMAWALLAAIMAVGVLALLFGEADRRRPVVVVAKPLASSCFVLVGGLALAGGDRFGVWIVAGLVLCLGGDLLLLRAHTFLAGLVSFLLGHLAYVAACASRLAVRRWWAAPLLPLALAAVLVLVWLWPHLGRMRVPVVAYVAAISVMVWGAVAVVVDGVAPLRLAVGAGLFYLSDLAVARNRFVSPGFVNRAWGLPLYYAGQLLIATTA
jgi:uncharacterized membrane protein YhhN